MCLRLLGGSFKLAQLLGSLDIGRVIDRGCICVLSVFRVRELEGKVRELENSVARMGAQLDVNMELINTFRSQKETVRQFSFVNTLLSMFYLSALLVRFDTYSSV